jgi:hypothetical protein
LSEIDGMIRRDGSGVGIGAGSTIAVWPVGCPISPVSGGNGVARRAAGDSTCGITSGESESIANASRKSDFSINFVIVRL